MSQLGRCSQPPICQAINPAGSYPVSAGFSFGGIDEGSVTGAMLTAEKCRDRAAECRVLAEHAPSPRVRDILIDVARTWTRLALEAEQWSRMNRPMARLSRGAPKTAAPSKPILPTQLEPRDSKPEP